MSKKDKMYPIWMKKDENKTKNKDKQNTAYKIK